MFRYIHVDISRELEYRVRKLDRFCTHHAKNIWDISQPQFGKHLNHCGGGGKIKIMRNEKKEKVKLFSTPLNPLNRP